MATVQQIDTSKPKGKCRKWRLWANRCKPRRSKRFTGTYTEAVEAARAFEAACIQAEGRAASALFLEYAQLWHDRRAASGEFAPGTLANDERAIRAFARTDLKDARLAEVTPEQARDALLWLRNNPARGKVLTGATVNKLYRAMFSIFAQAKRDGRISENPLATAKAPKVDTVERKALTPEQIASVLDRLDQMPMTARTMTVRIILMLGLRRGEVCGALASDLDLDAGVLHVRHAIKERDGSIGGPKSASGVRTLPIPPRLAEDLSEWLAVRKACGWGDAPTLCCNEYGRVMRPQLLQKWWNRTRGELGCEGFTLHELRHSNLSMMARHMPSAFDLQKWAGWSSLEPARVYIHADVDALRMGVLSAFDGTNAPKMHQQQ